MINFVAKSAFLNVNASQPFKWDGEVPKRGHLMRVSSIIRSEQLVDYLKPYGALLNPETIDKDEVTIYVKPHWKPGDEFVLEGKPYVDIIDGWGLIPILEANPDVPVIACSEQDFQILDKRLKNRIVFIPQHHCNFEREIRNREEITTVGIIGTEDSFEWIPKEIEEGLKKRGIKLLKYSKFFTREDVVNFYKQIDIQLVWRPYRMRLSNPLKIVNASSFGIPTIAYRETVFNEVNLGCIQVKNIEQFFSELDTFKEDDYLYKIASQDCLDLAEEYHISKVAEMYRSLI